MIRSGVLLVFLLVLPLSGAWLNSIYFLTVREGDDVTLPCEHVPPYQNQCQFTRWSIAYPPRSALFINGQRNVGVSSSLTLEPDCSLVLHQVKAAQSELYYCQHNQNGQERDTSNVMFVASVSQQKKWGRVTLTCSVTHCTDGFHGIKWLNNGDEVTESHGELQLSHAKCQASVSFMDQSPPSPFYRTLTCEVKQRDPYTILTLAPQPPSN